MKDPSHDRWFGDTVPAILHHDHTMHAAAMDLAASGTVFSEVLP